MSAEILNFPTKDGWQKALAMKNKRNWLMFCFEGKEFIVRHCHQTLYKEWYKDWTINEQQARLLYENNVPMLRHTDQPVNHHRSIHWPVVRRRQATWDEAMKYFDPEPNYHHL